jgi:hypothetical protein
MAVTDEMKSDRVPKGLQATVQVSGQPLNEYDDNEVSAEPSGIIPEHPTNTTIRQWRANRTICKYVEVIEGAKFVVNVTAAPTFTCPSPSLICDLKINDTSAGRQILLPIGLNNFNPASSLWFHGIHVSAPGAAPGRCLFRRFKFAKVEQSTSSSLPGY